MSDYILVTATPEDAHAQVLARVLESEHDVRCKIWDTSRFPAGDTLAYSPHRREPAATLEIADERLDVESLGSVWWRRPATPRISSSVVDAGMRRYCARESWELIRGLIDGIGVPVVNDPAAEARSESKPLQLAAAARLGLDVPRTLMTNDPWSVTDFWEEHDRDCIYKPFRHPYWQTAETRPLSAEDLKELPALRHAPMIVQERIPKLADVRVNIFGDAVFAARVQTTAPAADLDWRLDPRAEWSACDLPRDVADRLRSLLRELGLESGCVDLRQTPDGRFVFFEVNPCGQFLFVEIDTGQALTAALASLLVSKFR